jgi:hypothetical protein
MLKEKRFFHLIPRILLALLVFSGVWKNLPIKQGVFPDSLYNCFHLRKVLYITPTKQIQDKNFQDMQKAAVSYIKKADKVCILTEYNESQEVSNLSLEYFMVPFLALNINCLKTQATADNLKNILDIHTYEYFILVSEQEKAKAVNNIQALLQRIEKIKLFIKEEFVVIVNNRKFKYTIAQTR